MQVDNDINEWNWQDSFNHGCLFLVSFHTCERHKLNTIPHSIPFLITLNRITISQVYHNEIYIHVIQFFFYYKVVLKSSQSDQRKINIWCLVFCLNNGKWVRPHSYNKIHHGNVNDQTIFNKRSILLNCLWCIYSKKWMQDFLTIWMPFSRLEFKLILLNPKETENSQNEK